MSCDSGALCSGQPQRLFLLGHPIGHSKSPVMYNAVYPLLGLNWEYEFADIPAEEEAQAFLAARDFLSLNITTPYKPLAFAAADVRDASAVLAHGANVLVKLPDGALVAHNTDGQGCVLAIERGGFSFTGSRVAVCGTGPTSLAIMRACALAGAAEVQLLGRNAQRAQAVVACYQEECAECNAAAGEACIAGGSYADSRDYLVSCDLVVNATPLGMNAGDPAPFDVSVLHAGQTVFDCVYGHGTTELVRAARAAGCTTSDGAAMLVAQAIATVRIVCETTGVPVTLSDEQLFTAMAQAAGFCCY